MTNRNNWLAIADLDLESREKITQERIDVLETLESFAPNAIYNWRDFRRPGLALGTVQVFNDSAPEKRIIRDVLYGVLPEQLNLEPASYLPDIQD